MKTPIAGVLLALALAPSAFAHAQVSPPIVTAGEGQLFTLAVPTEKENAQTTSIELTPPDGFSIDSFVPSPGWKRSVRQIGSGEGAEIKEVVWSGGHVPTGEDAAFQFLASPDRSKSYTFKVRQSYSDGSVVDWSGPESSDTPAPVVDARSSLGSGGGSILSVVALVLAALALLTAAAAALAAAGKRTLA